MTVFGRDASNFDGAVSFSGLGYFTHKSTEGTTVVHDRYAERLNAGRAAGVPVLGAYHVVRTPGNGGNGSLAAQLAYWFAYLDAHTPWWRTHPHFMLQIDAERWQIDAVTAAIVKAFAQLVVGSGVAAYKVTYASRGQYGDNLAGIATDLWNADYRGSVNGSYPGDSWVKVGTAPAGWAPYSGKPPRFLQYASRPYDEDAFPGTLDELLTVTGSTGGTDDMDAAQAAELHELHDTTLYEIRNWTAGALQTASRLEAAAAEDKTRDAGMLVALQALASQITAGGGSVDVAAITTAVQAEAGTTRTLVEQLQQQLAAANAELVQLRQALGAGAQAQADALAPTAP